MHSSISGQLLEAKAADALSREPARLWISSVCVWHPSPDPVICLRKQERTQAAAAAAAEHKQRVLLSGVAGRMSQPFSFSWGSSGCPYLSVTNESTQEWKGSVLAWRACNSLKDQLLCVRLPESESA